MSTSTWRVPVRSRVVGGLVLGWLLACGGLPLPVGEVPLEHDLQGPEQQAALALASSIADATGDCDEHARALTWLAARHEDPTVVAASLRAMAACTGSLHPPDARAVAVARLRDEDLAVLGGAMALAATLAPDLEVDDPVLAGLVELASADGEVAVRIEALEALDKRAWGQEPVIAGAFYTALQAEGAPVVVATALERIRFRAAGLTETDQPRMLAACLVLAGDIDPAVRGLSALALARLAPDDDDVRARVLGLLDDDHPYTRSVAAQALAEMDYLPAVRPLVAGLPDPEVNTWQMLPWTRLDGTEDRKRFVGSRLERVDDAWLRAIQDLTAELDEPFVYRKVDLRYKDLDLVAARRDAVRWLAAHEGAVPER